MSDWMSDCMSDKAEYSEDDRSIPMASVLDHPAISRRYLFPQRRRLREPFWAPVAADVRIACYRRLVDRQARTLVHFHGNGEAVADYIPWMAEELELLGYNSLFVEYREYGESTGEAQLAAMLGDGAAAMEAADVEPQRAVAFGRSMGSLYAIELARRYPTLGGLILESGIADPAERFLLYANPADAGATDEQVRAEVARLFNHQQKLAAYPGPVLILHAENDQLVDVSHAERNFRWATHPQKRLVRFPQGDHNTILERNRNEYFAALRRFLASV